MPGQTGYEAITDPASALYEPANDWRNYDIQGSDAGVTAGTGTDWSALTNLFSSGGVSTALPSASTNGNSMLVWLQQNQTTVFVGAAILVALLVLKGRR